MKTLTATEAARRFADLLDSIEKGGESYLITRRGRPVARVVPAITGNGKALKELLKRHHPDEDWWREIKETRALLSRDVATDRRSTSSRGPEYDEGLAVSG